MFNYSSDDSFQMSSEIMAVPEWCRIYLAVYVILVFITGLPGNLLVMIVETKEKNKSSTDWFVLALAICDVTSLSFSVPVFFLGFTSLWTQVGSAIGCKVHTYVHFQTYLASAFLFAAIGFDRYMKICRPHSVYMTTTRAKRTNVAIAVVSSTLTFHHLFLSGLDANGQCIFQKYQISFSKFEQIVGGLIIIIVAAFVSVTYILVYRRMRTLGKKVAPSSIMISTTGVGQDSNNKHEKRNEKASEKCSTSLTNNTVPSKPCSVGSVKKIDAVKRKSYTENISETQEPVANSKHSDFCSIVYQYKAGKEKQSGLSPRMDNAHCTYESDSNQPDTTWRKSSSKSAVSIRSKRLKSTTKTMAIASIFYVIFTLVPSITSAVWTSIDGNKSQTSTTSALMVKLLYCIKLSINPYFYIAMSSRFRTKTIETLKRKR